MWKKGKNKTKKPKPTQLTHAFKIACEAGYKIFPTTDLVFHIIYCQRGLPGPV